MDRTGLIIGVKTGPGMMASPDMLDSIFSSDSSDDGFEDGEMEVSLSPLTTVTRIPSISLSPNKSRIESLGDATPRITAFLSALKNARMEPEFSGDIIFIPENSVPLEMNTLLEEFISKRTNEVLDQILAFDDSAFPDTVLAQIGLLKYTKDTTTPLNIWTERKLDSRIMTLIQYALAQDSDTSESVFHTISAIEEMVKFPSLAPISKLFSDFSLQNLISKLANDLMKLFPHNPILPSVLHNLSTYAPEIKNTLAQLEEDEDEDSDFSDDFFESIQQMKQTQASPMFQNLFETKIVNPLNLEGELPKSITTINEPPGTATYVLADGSDRLSPMKFQEWFFSIRCNRQETVNLAREKDFRKGRRRSCPGDGCAKSDPLPDLCMSADSDNEDDNDVDLAALYASPRDEQGIVSKMPAMVSLDRISLYLPIVHMMNTEAQKAITKGFAYPRLIATEFEAHTALIHGQSEIVNKALAYFGSLVTEEMMEKVHNVGFEKLKEKRNPPPLICEAPGNILAIMAAIDYEFVYRGRSPFDGATIGRNAADHVDCVIADNHVRGKMLYYFYTNEHLSSYIAFRLAFALAMNVSESDPVFASELMFEGLYIALESFKQFKLISCVRFGLLFLAELLEQLGSFYYSALILDNFFLANVRDCTFSTSVAQMCARNGDYLRAAFHFTQGLKHYEQTGQTEEALYVAQVLSSTFIDQGLTSVATSFLFYLLRKPYSMVTMNVRERARTVNFGTVKSPVKRNEAKPNHFAPNPKSLNTVLLAVKLIGLLIERRMFDAAENLLSSVESTVNSSQVQKFTNYSRSILYLKRNYHSDFLSYIPNLQIGGSGRAMSSRLSLLNASTFDPTTGSIKLLASSYIARKCWKEALFWSEMYIHAVPKNSFKDVGYGLLSRGNALSAAYKLGYEQYEFTDDLPCNGSEGKKIGTVMRASLSREECFCEAIASFATARLCFEKVGCIALQNKALLAQADLFLCRVSKENPDASFEINPVSLITTTAAKTSLVVAISPFDCSLETLTAALRAAEPSIAKLMNPVDIISHEIFTAKCKWIDGEEKEAKLCMDYAYENFTKYFCCGSEFLARDLSVTKLTRFHTLLEHYCDLLVSLDREYINNHLIMFDIMNDLRYLRQLRQREPTPPAREQAVGSIDFTDQMFELESAHLPEFKNLLTENGFCEKCANSMKSLQLSEMLKQITANIHLFESGKITEDEMILKNTKLCRRIETFCETVRRQRAAQLPPEWEFTFAVRSCPKASGCVFVHRIFHKIVIYVPQSGAKRTLSFFTNVKTLKLKEEDDTKTITLGLLPEPILRFMCSLLSDRPTPCPPKCMRSFSSLLFGAITDNFYCYMQVNDFHSFKKRKSEKKHSGSLASLSCGNNPVIVISSIDLQPLPFEMMIENCCILRSFTYSAILRRQAPATVPVPAVFKASHDDDTKPLDVFTEALLAASAEFRPKEPMKRYISQILPFSPKKGPEYFAKKYPFLEIVAATDAPIIPTDPAMLFIVDYKDLFNVPNALVGVLRDCPHATVMFIPKSMVKGALDLMEKVIKRHEKRKAYFETHQDENAAEVHMAVLNDAFINVTTLKATLEKELRIPIPVFISVW